eukprot:TRINITY_DN5554_c0_g1_i1.p1 TRINITY_DN5554_c0_g1~~TRINITY_DN5554_c0_g1_i1.p1  ORF type:complete len:474 (-),score=64.32 TRINITY_DN5554_c0_g1_i1:235-1656(-)
MANVMRMSRIGQANRTLGRSQAQLMQMEERIVQRVLERLSKDIDDKVSERVGAVLSDYISTVSDIRKDLEAQTVRQDIDACLPGAVPQQDLGVVPLQPRLKPKPEDLAEEPFACTAQEVQEIQKNSIFQPSFCLAVAHQTLKPGPRNYRKAAWMAAGCVIWTLQAVCMLGLNTGIFIPSCNNNEQCAEGVFCSIEQVYGYDTPRRGRHHVCIECSVAETVSATNNSTAFCQSNPGSNLCLHGGCHDVALYGDGWNPWSFDAQARQNVQKMSMPDWLCLCVAFLFICIEIGRESADIMALEAVVKAHGCQLPETLILLYGAAVRQHVLLPLLATGAVFCVFHLGSSSMEIFFNSLAVLFMLQLDDLLFHVFLGAESHAELEDSALIVTDEPTLSRIERCMTGQVLGYFTFMVVATVWVLVQNRDVAKTYLPVVLTALVPLIKVPSWRGVLTVWAAPLASSLIAFLCFLFFFTIG